MKRYENMSEVKKKIESKSQANGESMGFEEIYRSCYKEIYTYIYRFIRHRENAEDIAENVFVNVYKNFSRLDLRRGTIYAWIYAIARNAVIDFKKRASFRYEVISREPEQAGQEISLSESGGRDDTLRNPDNIWLEHLLMQLKEEEINLLALRYQVGLSNTEIGAIMNLSADAVSKRCCRLLKKCREYKFAIKKGL